MLFSILSTLSVSLLATISKADDLEVLNYALTLEHLENAFYQEGLQNFTSDDFKKENFHFSVYGEFQNIASHEKTHVATLMSAINASYPGKAVPPCKYAFGVTSVKEFVATARALERTGVSAYLGRVTDISLGAYLTAAGSIMTVEARHSSFLNTISGISGAPQPFDTPLDPMSVLSIASQFIVSCPFDLGAKPNPKLEATVMDGSLKTSYGSAGYCKYSCGSMTYTSKLDNMKCSLPKMDGTDIYVSIVSSTDKDAKVLAGPAVVSVNTNKSTGARNGDANNNNNANTSGSSGDSGTSSPPSSSSYKTQVGFLGTFFYLTVLFI